MVIKQKQIIIALLLATLLSVLCVELYPHIHEKYFLKIPECNLSSEISSYKKINTNAGCLIQRDDTILFVKLFHGGKITIPGGTAKKGESSSCTAHRETYEETGLNVKVVRKIITAQNGFEIFLCETSENLNPKYKKPFEVKSIFFADPKKTRRYKYPTQLNQIIEYLDSQTGGNGTQTA